MLTPAELLFENQPDINGSLFKNRIELAKLLIQTKNSHYYESADDPTIFNRSINKLQSYLSHLIAGTGMRKITPELKNSLTLLIKNKLNDEERSSLIVGKIFESIEYYNQNKNSISHKNTSIKVIQTFNEMLQTARDASYVVVFTNRPIELEADPDKYSIQIRQRTIDAILDYSFKKSIVKYRFNFPNENVAILFWRKLSYLLVKELLYETPDKSPLIDKFLLERNFKLENFTGSNEELKLKYKIDKFLTIVNEEAWIQVFCLNEPVFVVPHIVFNPNERNNKSEGYILITSDSENLIIHKYQPYDLENWREKVWDLLKLNRKSNQIKYEKSLEKNLDEDFKLNLK